MNALFFYVFYVDPEQIPVHALYELIHQFRKKIKLARDWVCLLDRGVGEILRVRAFFKSSQLGSISHSRITVKLLTKKTSISL